MNSILNGNFFIKHTELYFKIIEMSSGISNIFDFFCRIAHFFKHTGFSCGCIGLNEAKNMGLNPVLGVSFGFSSLTSGNLPGISNFWKLNQEYARELFCGQYAAQVYYEVGKKIKIKGEIK